MDRPLPVVPPGGSHFLLDMQGCKRLDDLVYIASICRAAAEATGATVIGENFHHFGDGCGISGVILLAESHLSIHTWPENDFASVDVYVCGECDVMRAKPVLLEGFFATTSNSMVLKREPGLIREI